MSEQARILVVDDDPDFLDFARTILESGSYKVVVTPGEEEALAEIEKKTPDLLILDVMMSGLDSGFQFMWKLKGDDSYKTIPIVIATAVDKEMRIDFAKHAHSPRTADDESYLPVEDYIVKPVKADELLSKVKSALGRTEKETARR